MTVARAIHVVAGALFDAQGRVLIAQRPPGKHMAGGWEFPGGKLATGERPFDGLKRELEEEIGIDVQSAEQLIAYEHTYAERSVFLDLWHVTRYGGVPQSREGQPIKWIAIGDLPSANLLEADKPMIAVLQRRFKER